jgi:hypothetical protein
VSRARLARVLGGAACAASVVGAVVAPALAFDAATVRGGAPRSSGDLLLASSVVGVPYAAFLLRVLFRGDGRTSGTDRWLSAVHGLVVLWIAASALPAAALHLTSRLHARVVDAEWPVLAGWAGTLAVAVLLAERTRRASLRWLSRAQEASPAPQ